MDAVFKALADPSRRQLLDGLNARDGQSLRELSESLEMTRQAVSKHLAVLENAGLVAAIRRGRQKLHYLNRAPINDISERWIDRYNRERVHALADLKRALEDSPMDKPKFVYVTYIETTPERLWQALTDPAFTRRYWGAELRSDWRTGSPVLWKENTEDFVDLDQVVLESEPYRRLSYSWHTWHDVHRKLFGWTEEKLAGYAEEPRSKVTFELEPVGTMVKLTVVHDDFEPGSEMLKAISGGWPGILSSLKTLLETGQPLPQEDAELAR